MEWLVIGLIVMGVLGAIGKSSEQNKTKAEAAERKARAEAAREAILKSGNPELIQRLQLMEAARGTATQTTVAQSRSSDALRTAAGVAGGLIVADAITTQMHLAALEDAFADIQNDISADLTSAAGDASEIFNLDI